jgi:ABC-type uncharacterized transport system fused permease/ATPase subunit
MQEKKEADFRYGLVRVRENAESIAFYGGEENEVQLLLDRFRRAFENLSVSVTVIFSYTLVRCFCISCLFQHFESHSWSRY